MSGAAEKPGLIKKPGPHLRKSIPLKFVRGGAGGACGSHTLPDGATSAEP